MTDMMATMMRSQGQVEQKEPGGAEESATVKERPEWASPASRAGNSPELTLRRNLRENVGDQVRALPEEDGPERPPGASDQEWGANPAGESTPSETNQICRYVLGYVNTAKYPVPIFDKNNEDFHLWARYAMYYAKHDNLALVFSKRTLNCRLTIYIWTEG